jgi:hypothetical protein
MQKEGVLTAVKEVMLCKRKETMSQSFEDKAVIKTEVAERKEVEFILKCMPLIN